MKKNLLALILVLGLAIFVGGCGKKQVNKTNGENENSKKSNATTEVKIIDTKQENTVIKDCGESTECAGKLLTDCVDGGKFTLVGERGYKNYIEISKKENICYIKSNQLVADYAVLGAGTYDKDGDGFLDLNCPISGIKTTDELTAYTKNNLAKCTGEMTDFFKALEAMTMGQ